MKVRHEDIYPLSPDALFRVFTDKAFYEARYNSAHSETEFAQFGERNGRFLIDVKRHVRLKEGLRVPSVARRFVKEVNILHILIDWEITGGANRRGTNRVLVEGVPVEMTGRMELAPHGNGCINRLEIEVKCSIPLIGGTIADLLGERVGKTLEKDHAAAMKYLRDNGLVKES